MARTAPATPLLSRGFVWMPPDATMSDRHALMDRQTADDYFRRWELIQSRDLLNTSSLASLRVDPGACAPPLRRRRPIRLFPPTMVVLLPPHAVLRFWHVQSQGRRSTTDASATCPASITTSWAGGASLGGPRARRRVDGGERLGPAQSLPWHHTGVGPHPACRVHPWGSVFTTYHASYRWVRTPKAPLPGDQQYR